MNVVPNWLIENSIIVAAAIPMVWLIGRCRTTRPAELHLLWLILLVKLVTPPVTNWPVALHDLAAKLRSADSTPTKVESDIKIARTSVTQEDLELAIAELRLLSADELELTGATAASIASQPDTEPDSTSFPWIGLVIGTWGAGTVVIAGFSLFRVLRLVRFLRAAEPVSPELQALISRMAARYRLTPIPAYLAKGFASPCIACLLRPVLLWPDSLRVEDDPRGAESILAHEFAHLARRDHWVARFELPALWAGWWNPLFWVVRWQLHESRELACDALSMEVAASDRRAFAELLLEFSQIRRPVLSAVSMVGTGIAARLSLRRRLKMLFDHRVSGRLSLTSLSLAAVFGVAVLPGFTQGQEKSEDAAPVEDEVGAVIELKVDVQNLDSVVSEDAKTLEPVIVQVENNKDPIEVVSEAKLVAEDVFKPSPDHADRKPGKGEIKGYRIVANDKKNADDEPESGEGGELFKLHEGAQSIRVRLLGPNVVEIEEIGPNLKSVRVLKMQVDQGGDKPKKTRIIKANPDAKVLHVELDDLGRAEVEVEAKIAELANDLDRAKVEAARAQKDVARAVAEKMRAVAVERAEHAQKVAADQQARAADIQFTRTRHEADRESLQEELELSQLGLMEKEIELEEASEHAKKTPDDSAAMRRLKLAELGVRRAKVEMNRVQRRLGQIDRHAEAK